MVLPDFLTRDALGYVHLTGHRIGLQDVVYFYNEGFSPEMLNGQFPTLSVPLLEKTIAFYRDHGADVDAYIAQCDTETAGQRAGAKRGPTVEELRQRFQAQASNWGVIMALRYLLDENQRGVLWRALERHNARGIDVLDVARVGEPVDLPLGTPDPLILRWAEREDRILVTYDRHTMATHLSSHLASSRHSPGIFMVKRGCRLRDVLEFVVLAAYASDPEEWRDRITFIPE